MSPPSELAGMKAVRDDPNVVDPDELPFMEVTGYVDPCMGVHFNEGCWALYCAEPECCNCVPAFVIGPN